MAETSLYNAAGKRLYLTADERLNFLDAAKSAPPKVRTLCETLAYTGCRISEALELSAARIDLDSQRVIVRSLKKRRHNPPFALAWLKSTEMTWGAIASWRIAPLLRSS